MYLITDTYFTREFEIPNASEGDSKALVELESFIDEKCRQLIRQAIGNTNADALDGYLVNGLLPDVPTLPDPDLVPVKWRNLVTGCSYTKDGKTYKWKGFTYTDGIYKGSLLTPFTYYHWLENNVSYVAGVGEVKAQSKNAMAVNSTQRLVNSWNRFVEMYQGNIRHSFDYILDWGFWDFGYCSAYNDGSVSLIQFLRDNATDYPESPLKTFKVINQLGL